MNVQPGFLLTVLCNGLSARLRSAFRKRPRPAHILFCMVDHFEPGTERASPEVERGRMEELLAKYPPLADAHRDAAGNPPRRTWFFPPHYHRRGNLRDLASLCERGYGEIELHLHHGKSAPDTPEHLAHTIRLCLRDYAEFGVFGHQQGQTRYGFVHGDWALSNSRKGGQYCGVDNELEILQDTGCYADFTFPSCNEANPAQLNSIFYADVRRHGPKSYSRGVPVRAGAGPQPGLLLIQGPVRLMWVRGRPTFADSIHDSKPLTPHRIDSWVATRIHVAGKPDWVILKTYTHGAPNGSSVLGPSMHAGLTYLEQAYNDGTNYVLHYVTARELYNIIKAAEAGETGDPEQYRNYLVGPPRYNSRVPVLEASAELREAVYKTYVD